MKGLLIGVVFSAALFLGAFAFVQSDFCMGLWALGLSAIGLTLLGSKT